MMLAKVRILPECELDYCLKPVQPWSHKRICAYTDQQPPHDNPPTSTSPRPLNRFSSAHMTWWPSWVYKLYDAVSIISDSVL